MAALSNGSPLSQQIVQHIVDHGAPIKGLFEASNPLVPITDAVNTLSAFVGDDLALELHQAHIHMTKPQCVKKMQDNNVSIDEVWCP
jgi:hypothetical protein